jgi:hypothetical protein
MSVEDVVDLDGDAEVTVDAIIEALEHARQRRAAAVTGEHVDFGRPSIPTFTIAYREGANTVVEIVAAEEQANTRRDQLTAQGVHAVIGRHRIWLRTPSEARYGRTARKTHVPAGF